MSDLMPIVRMGASYATTVPPQTAASTFEAAAAPSGWAGHSVTDVGGRGVYTKEAWRRAPRIDSDKLAGLVHADPARIVLLGEGHGAESDLTSTTLAQDLQDKGEKVVFGVEMPSDDVMRGVVRDYQVGRIAKDDFISKFSKSFADYNIKSGEHTDSSRAQKEGNYNATMLSYVKERGMAIALVDTGRAEGGSRNAAMASNIEKLATDNPGARIVVAMGATHAARTGDWPSSPNDSEGFRADRSKPAGLRLEQRFGDEKVLSLFIDGSNRSIVAGELNLPLKAFDHIVVGPQSSLDHLPPPNSETGSER